MKKLVTISLAMSALFFVSISANAQRSMERRDQSNQDEQYARNDNDQYNRGNDNDQYNRGSERVNSRRPQVTVVFSTNGNRGNGGYNDRRYHDNRRYNDYGRHDRYDRNRGCQPYRRGRY